MKTIWKTSLFLVLLGSFAVAGAAQSEKSPALKLVDMYSKAEGDHFKIYIVANGDISQYKTTRKTNHESYKLTIDVPALPPRNKKYDINTPFSRRFEVWPMMLGTQVYARISMELNLEASSVVGMDGPARIWVTISSKSALAVADSRPAPQSTPGPVLQSSREATPAVLNAEDSDELAPPVPAGPMEAPPLTKSRSAANDKAAVAPVLDSENEEFFSLFPTPSGGQERSIFHTPVDLSDDAESIPDGIRLGRFLYRPMVYGSWLRGDNLLLLSDATFDDSAILFRARNAFDLLYSENVLRLVYELRFKNFRKYKLHDRFSHFFEFESELNLTPTMVAKIENHFARGNTESTEYDPGRELAFNTEPYYRNLARGALQMDLSERLGLEFFGAYNVVEFVDEPIAFYNYTDQIAGFDVLYYLSPLTTIFGEYQRMVRPEPVARPIAASQADTILAGIRGEITPMLTGTARAGYQSQEFGVEPLKLYFKGLVADANLSYRLGEQTILSGGMGRANNPSNFELNSYYTSNYANVRLVAPVWRELRLNTRVSFIGNAYPLPASEIGVPRRDDIKNASIGILYYFTRQGFVQFDFLHERRDSNLDTFSYRNNVLQFIFGWGFMSQ